MEDVTGAGKAATLNGMVTALPSEAYVSSPIRKPRSSARYWGMRLAWLCALIWIAGLFLGFQQSVRALTVLGLIATIVGMSRPTIGTLGIGILCTMDALTRVFVMTGGLLRWNTFNYVLLVAMALHIPLLLQRRELPTRILLLLIVLLTIHLLLGPSITGGAQHILGAVAFFGLLIYFVRGSKDPLVWKWLAVVCGVIGALGGFVYFLQESNLPPINKNAWAFLPLTPIFAACLARSASQQRKPISNLMWLLVVANVVWVVLSGSRGGMTIAASCLLYLLSGMKGMSNRVIILTAGALLSAILLSRFAEQKEYVIHRFEKSVDTEYSLASRTSGRSDLAIGGWRMFLEHPIMGVGTGGFAIAWKDLRNREGLGNYAADRHSEAHSGWIKTLAEGGLPAFMLHLAFVLSFCVAGYRTEDRPLVFLGILVTVTLLVSFISTEFQGKAIWFFAAGATVVLDRAGQRRLLRPQRRPTSLSRAAF